MRDGSVCKTRALHLTHLDTNPIVNSPLLVGIHKDWLRPKMMEFNLSALLVD